MQDYFTHACRKAETTTGSEKIAWQKEVQRMTDILNEDRLMVDTSLPKSSGNASNPVYNTGTVTGTGTLTAGGNVGVGRSFTYTINSVGVGPGVLTTSSDRQHVGIMELMKYDQQMNPSFFEIVDGHHTKAELAAEPDLTAFELLHIIQLLNGISNGGQFGDQRVKPISFIKQHNLVRHFRLTHV